MEDIKKAQGQDKNSPQTKTDRDAADKTKGNDEKIAPAKGDQEAPARDKR